MAPAHYFSGLALLATGKFNEAKPLLGALVGVSVTGLPVKDLSDIDGLGGEEEFKEKPYVPETDSNQSEGL
jgi:hypothetical protein